MRMLARLTTTLAALLLALGAGATTAHAAPAPPTSTPTTISGTPSPNAIATGSTSIINEAVTVSGTGATPTGAVTFSLFDNATCTGPQVLGGTSSLDSSGNTTFSYSWHATTDGVYYWFASYPGDAGNDPSATACGDKAQRLYVNASGTVPALASPVLDGTASPQTATAGTTLTVGDTAALTGGDAPTGTVTFNLYANATCTGTPTLTGTGPLDSSATATTSLSWTPHAGTYHWQAVYAGDSTNNPASTVCTAAKQTVDVAKAIPTLTAVTAPQTTLVGDPVTLTDTATLTDAAFSPSGLVEFALFDNPNCDGTPIIDDVAPIVGTHAVFSVDVTPPDVGTFYFAAYFPGNSDNLDAATDCGDPAEALDVVAPLNTGGAKPPTITPTSIPDVPQQLPMTGPYQVRETALGGTALLAIGTGLLWSGRRRRPAPRH